MEPPVVKEFTSIADAAQYFVYIAGKHPYWAYAIYCNSTLSMYYVIKARDYHRLPSNHPILRSGLIAAADLATLRELSSRFPPDLLASIHGAAPLPPDDADNLDNMDKPEESNDHRP